MRSIDQRIEHLKNQILDGLTQKGILNELQSRFLSNVAQFIQTTEYDVFKPHRERRRSPEYEIAEFIVSQYLKTKNMVHSYQSILSELKINEHEIDFDSEKSSQIIDKIKIENNGLWIRQIIKEWNIKKNVLIKQNKEYDREIVKKRLYQIDNKASNENNNENENSNIQHEFDNKNIKQEDNLPRLNSNQSKYKTNEPSNIEDNIEQDYLEEEIENDSSSQDDKPGNPIWIIDSPTAQANDEGSSHFVSDDGEPPILFSKPINNNGNINLKVNQKTDLNEKTDIKHIESSNISQNNNSKSINKYIIKQMNDNSNIIATKNINDNDIDGTLDFNSEKQNDINELNNKQSNNNINPISNDKNMNDDIGEQNSFGFDVDFENDDNAKISNQIKDKSELVSENKTVIANDQKDKLLSDEFEEPERTPKREINHEDDVFFDDFNDDYDQEIEPSSKKKQNLANSKAPTNNNRKSMTLSGSDVELDNFIESDNPILKPNKSEISANKSKNQASDSSLDFSSGSFNDVEPKIMQNHKQTKKIGSNSSIDFDIDFSDDSPAKTANTNKKDQKKGNNENEAIISDIEIDFSDDSPVKTASTNKKDEAKINNENDSIKSDFDEFDDESM